MKLYTVLLLYPDYVASNYGEETYLAHVTADTVPAAQEAAQREVYTAHFPNPDDDTPGGNSWQDFAVLAVFEGHINDLKETTS